MAKSADRLVKQVSKWCIAVSINLALHRYRKLTCHLGSHSVTCHPTGENPAFNPSQSRYSIYRPWRDARLSWPMLRESGPARIWIRDLSIASLTLYCSAKMPEFSSNGVNYTISLLRTKLSVFSNAECSLVMEPLKSRNGCTKKTSSAAAPEGGTSSSCYYDVKASEL